jgi:hypothetical protein
MRDLILKTLRESVKAYPELKGYLSDEALRLIKQMEDEPDWWRERFKPYDGDTPFVFDADDWQITEADIRKAIREWDKLMPEYAGMLEAEVEAGDGR